MSVDELISRILQQMQKETALSEQEKSDILKELIKILEEKGMIL